MLLMFLLCISVSLTVQSFKGLLSFGGKKKVQTLWILPEQKVTKTTGGDLFKGVHLELVAVVVGFLRSYIWSRTKTGQKHRVERGQRGVSFAADWFVAWIKQTRKVMVLSASNSNRGVGPLKVCGEVGVSMETIVWELAESTPHTPNYSWPPLSAHNVSDRCIKLSFRTQFQIERVWMESARISPLLRREGKLKHPK